LLLTFWRFDAKANYGEGTKITFNGGVELRTFVSAILRSLYPFVFCVFFVKELEMKMSANQFRQESYNGIEFVSDCRNGSIHWASYGADTVGYSPLVKGDLEAKDGGVLDLIILWVLGFRFGVADCVNDFLSKVVPIVKERLRQIQGWTSVDDVNNMLTDIWMCLSGAKSKVSNFDPNKGKLSTWVGYRCFGHVTDKLRRKKLAKKLAGLSLIVDDDIPLSSIGDAGLLGLTFESSDSDEVRGKWTKLSPKKSGVLEEIVQTENEVAVERALSRIDPIDRKMLEMHFLQQISCQDIRDSVVRLGLIESITMNGVRKRIMRVVNGLRQKLQPGSPPVVGLKGRHGRVSIMEEIETD
jgi:hypothetical protein